MSLLLPVAAALVFVCEAPTHHDGDAIRCRGQQRSMRLHAIDAPEMPGACAPGRRCTPGDPHAARDHLASLTRGRTVRCEEVDIDRYGRIVARCTADGLDLGCAMVAAGHAVERYGRLNCAHPITQIASPQPLPDPIVKTDEAGGKRYFAPPDAPTAEPPPRWTTALVALYLLGINLFGAILLGNDARIANASAVEQRRQRRLSNASFLTVAIGGGGPGMALYQLFSGHKSEDIGFSRAIMLLSGLWFGVLAGIAVFLLD